MDKKKLIEEMFEKGILVNEDMLQKGVDDTIVAKVETEADLMVLNEDYANVISQQTSLVDWHELDKHRVAAEKERDDELYQSQLQSFQKSKLVLHTQEQQQQEVSSLETEIDDSIEFNTDTETVPSDHAPLESVDSLVTVVLSYENIPHTYTIKDFTRFFVSRYKFIEGILRNRQELQQASTIKRILDKKERESVALIGVVQDISETKNGNLMLTLEDLTGMIKVLVSRNKSNLYAEGKDLVLDEVIGISGMCGEKIVFADTIVWPDIPSSHELKKGPEEEYIVFLSDVHVGSKLFMDDAFNKFIKWIRGELGNETQRSIAKKVKYVIIAGDLVDGIGIYPSQEEELSITTIDGQYEEFARLVKQIPEDKEIIMCPGNHDAVHLAEPQPVFYQKFAPNLFDIPNATLVTNPSIVNIGKKEDFPGFNILLYHGYSFDYYVANVESIRNGGGYHRSDLIMKFLLKRRHLAPSFKSTPYYPSHNEDPLLIKTIPDFLITGHIHYSSVANYKGVTMISGSCWQAKTTFQEKLGHEPEPARVPLVNLKTREVKVLRFG